MSTERPTTTQGEAQDSGERPATPRKPYVTPRLRSLGSVRDLTLAGSSGLGEAGGMMMM